MLRGWAWATPHLPFVTIFAKRAKSRANGKRRLAGDVIRHFPARFLALIF